LVVVREEPGLSVEGGEECRGVDLEEGVVRGLFRGAHEEPAWRPAAGLIARPTQTGVFEGVGGIEGVREIEGVGGLRVLGGLTGSGLLGLLRLRVHDV
jgi:hypothetical protein